MTRRDRWEIVLWAGLVMLLIYTCIVLAEISAGGPGMSVAWRGGVAVVAWEQDREGSAVVTRCSLEDCPYFVGMVVDAKAGPHELLDLSPRVGADYFVSFHGAVKGKLGPVTLPWRLWLVGVKG